MTTLYTYLHYKFIKSFMYFWKVTLIGWHCIRKSYTTVGKRASVSFPFYRDFTKKVKFEFRTSLCHPEIFASWSAPTQRPTFSIILNIRIISEHITTDLKTSQCRNVLLYFSFLWSYICITFNTKSTMYKTTASSRTLIKFLFTLIAKDLDVCCTVSSGIIHGFVFNSVQK